MISPLHFDRCLANGIRNWSAPFTKHGSVFSTVNQNHSNVSFWICMWVWELAVISTVEVKKKWIQYPFLICVDASICRKMLCKGVSCCEWFIISDEILIETISAIIGKLTELLFSINFIQLRGFPQKLTVFLCCLWCLCHILAHLYAKYANWIVESLFSKLSTNLLSWFFRNWVISSCR